MQMSEDAFSIRNATRQPTPKLPFEEMKTAVLGKSYSLSFVLCGDTTSRKLNRAHRGKDKPTNILSYPLDKGAGEIFINLLLSRKQAKIFGRKPDNFVAFLFIHGLVHLKGYDHGSRMERKEAAFRKRFGI